MAETLELETPRLTLRQWTEEDFSVFAELNADPLVMKYFPATLNESESNIMAARIQSLIAQRGWGFWAVEEKCSGRFIGFVGLHIPLPELPFSPCVETGWRLAREYWGKGYATEAAKMALNVAFGQLGMAEVYSFTAVANLRSRAVMERLGLVNTGENFGHPKIPIGHPLREHVLYRITGKQWGGHESD